MRTVEYRHEGRVWTFDARTEVGTDLVVLNEVWADDTYAIAPEDVALTGIVVDLGANIGSFTIRAVALGAQRVVAVEPNAGNLEALERNLENNGIPVPGVVAVAHGACGHRGWVQSTGYGGGANVEPVTQDTPGAVPCMTLDEYLDGARIGAVDVLKIDTEGGEYDIIDSASDGALEVCRKIVMEYHAACPDGTPARLGSLVERLSESHRVSMIGQASVGGLLWATRY